MAIEKIRYALLQNNNQINREEDENVKFDIRQSFPRLKRSVKEGARRGAHIGGGVGFAAPIFIAATVSDRLDKLPLSHLISDTTNLAGYTLGLGLGLAGAATGGAAGATFGFFRSTTKGAGNMTGLRKRQYQNDL